MYAKVLTTLAHATRCSRQPIHTSASTTWGHPLVLFNHISYSSLEFTPINGSMICQNPCKSLLIGSKGWGLTLAVINPVARYQG